MLARNSRVYSIKGTLASGMRHLGLSNEKGTNLVSKVSATMTARNGSSFASSVVLPPPRLDTAFALCCFGGMAPAVGLLLNNL